METDPHTVSRTSGIVIEDRGCARILRLNRPGTLNAFDRPMLAEFKELVHEADRDPAVVGLVVTGTGRGFCSGLDHSALRELADQGSSGLAGTGRPPGERAPLLFGYLIGIDKPVIAAVNGVVAGGGFVLALSCDFRFSAPEAEFVTSFARRGLVAEHATSWLLPRLVGTSHALDLLLSSRRIGVAEAERIGLTTRVTPDPVTTACEYIDQLADSVSPASMRDIKRQVYRDWARSFEDSAESAYDLNAAALDRPDAREGAASLIERRPPSFARLGE